MIPMTVPSPPAGCTPEHGCRDRVKLEDHAMAARHTAFDGDVVQNARNAHQNHIQNVREPDHSNGIDAQNGRASSLRPAANKCRP